MPDPHRAWNKRDCPCGSNRLFKDCCGLYLGGAKFAPTAETLMRSRYSAFCLRAVEYLIQTHHPKHRDQEERSQLRQTIQTTQWLKLSVLKVRQGCLPATVGTVEFIAYFRTQPGLHPAIAPAPQQRISQLHELSRFVYEAGQWFYVDGEQRSPRWPKRHQRCWCGSGQAFKTCHGQ